MDELYNYIIIQIKNILYVLLKYYNFILLQIYFSCT